ncbi:MAG: hypothetical protein FGM32_02210 [Candidatus Kapabacteria bacterium]|nr:hypothetical protein [Candidatus Kapabacteria bacterium]
MPEDTNQRSLSRTQYIAILVASASFSLAVVIGLRGDISSAMMLVVCGLLPVVVAFRGVQRDSADR